jgi:hypothetical protein
MVLLELLSLGLRRARREDSTVHGDLANSAESVGVTTQSQRMKAKPFALFAKNSESNQPIPGKAIALHAADCRKVDAE